MKWISQNVTMGRSILNSSPTWFKPNGSEWHFWIIQRFVLPFALRLNSSPLKIGPKGTDHRRNYHVWGILVAVSFRECMSIPIKADCEICDSAFFASASSPSLLLGRCIRANFMLTFSSFDVEWMSLFSRRGPAMLVTHSTYLCRV